MSNGTRIDPEDHEPRAIKIGGRKTKKSKSKIILSVVGCLAIIAIGVSFYMIFGDSIDLPKFPFGSEKNENIEVSSSESGSDSEIPVSSSASSSEEDVSSVSSSSSYDTSSEPEPSEVENVIPRDEWYMVLVNKDNPLPEDFIVDTALIDNRSHTVDSRIHNDLLAMIEAGEKEGLKFIFYTAYRSVSRQRELYEAGQTTAAPGTSEHNSGLAIDIGSASSDDFEGSSEETWLLEHAHEFGFILRYPKDKESITGFDFEPWHFRYVGKEQAAIIHELGVCLEEYLVEE